MSDAPGTTQHDEPAAKRTKAGAWIGDVRRAVDGALVAYLEKKTRAAHELTGGDTTLVEAIAELTMRGGKRLRPAVLVAAYHAVAREGASVERVLPASCALELLQTYLLIHDDWMDGDDERRGGPSVHAALRTRVGDAKLGDALAILAGDLGSSYAWELLFENEMPARRTREVCDAFVRIHQEVVLGQQLDLLATPDVSRMQRLKTGSYTVSGPLRLGALLGDADATQLGILEAFGAPLGEAFQVRDDLLGTFGDPKVTGKPIGNDLRAGKRTALVLECEATTTERRALDAVLGRADATDEAIGEAMALFEREGVRARVEARLESLLGQARAALASERLSRRGVEMLDDLVAALALRDH